METYKRDPWGEQRADMRNAQLVAAVIKGWAAAGSKIEPSAYMLFPEGGRLSEEDQWDVVLQNAARRAAAAEAQTTVTTGG